MSISRNSPEFNTIDFEGSDGVDFEEDNGVDFEEDNGVDFEGDNGVDFEEDNDVDFKEDNDVAFVDVVVVVLGVAVRDKSSSESLIIKMISINLTHISFLEH